MTSIRVTAAIGFRRRRRTDLEPFAGIGFCIRPSGYTQGLHQLIRCREDLVLGKGFRKPRGLCTNLYVVTCVLRIEHVEQRTASDIELLTIGKQQVVRNLGLTVEFAGQLALAGPSILRNADVLFSFTG